MDALELSSELKSSDQTDLSGETSIISFRVAQNGKQYKLSCRINVTEKKSPFSEFTIGSQNYASYFKMGRNC